MDILFTALDLLCNQCDLPTVKRKQKMLARVVLRYINTSEIPESILELKKCLTEICNLHIKFPEEPGNVIIEMIRLENFPDLKDTIYSSSQKNLEVERINSFLELITTKIKSLEILTRTDDIVKQLIDIKSLDSDFEVLNRYKSLIHKEYIEILKQDDENDTHSELEISESLDENSIKEIINEISIVSKRRVRLKSGIGVLDKFLLSGFESTRIYIFGGKPGLGKSALILNFFVNAAKQGSSTVKKKKPETLVYITLENDTVETFERLSRIITGTPISLNKITVEEENTIIHAIKNFNKVIKIKYMIPYKTTTMDIFMYLDKISEEYTIRGVFIDYLNLISSAEKTKSNLEKRFELGMVTAELKVIGKRFQCPVVVPTQLNTSGYDGVPTMKNLDESRQIAQNADFVGLMFEYPIDKLPMDLVYNFPEEQYKIIGINIDKHRNAPTGMLFLCGQKELYTFSDSGLKDVQQTLKNRLRSSKRNENENNGYTQLNSQQLFNQVGNQYNNKILNTIG